MEVAVRIQDPSGAVSRDVVVRAEDGHLVADFVDVLVDVMEWPRETLAGVPVTYRVRRLGAAAPLDETGTVAALGLRRGEVLVLGPADSHAADDRPAAGR